jgi:ATP-binding cassette, subfamily B, bacterial
VSTTTNGTSVDGQIPQQPAPPVTESVLPELRNAWWEHGVRRRAETGVFGVFADLPKLIGHAVAVSWQADRLRTLIVAAATLGGGVMSTFGLLSAQRLLV